MSKICISVLVGLPGVGKTTFCKAFKHYLEQKQSPIAVIRISFDDFIRFDNEQDFENGLCKTQRKQLLECIEMIVRAVRMQNFETLHEANEILMNLFRTNVLIDMNNVNPNTVYLFVLDDNMYYRSMRFDVLKMARKYSTGFFQIFFDVPLSVATARNAARSNQIPQDVLLRMAMRLEQPNERFYKWEANCFSTCDPLREFAEIETIIAKYLNNPEHPSSDIALTQPAEQSVIHKLDLLLRKIVGDVIQSRKTSCNKKNELKKLFEELNRKRKTILSDARNGLVEIDINEPNQENIRKLFENNH
ncbi:L-seryl-tRNA(Sec) kinase [Wyeomyia smithii]|uniref:L-seryl-tRNA(Sec) kinase n=1 Tax=Wyeomyia smithii TaxID=174621 RepID=UPI002467EF2E|nr:L-seryl-tRNA(Sec) kinase [Wyeomyia smithii]